jgi:hypothetical protein
LFSVAFH